LDHIRARNATQSGSAAAHHARSLEAVAATWSAIDGDVLRALSESAQRGVLELWTTSASHAYLPGLSDASIATQLDVGRQSFAALSGSAATAMWLPECAIDARVGAALATLGVPYTLVDEHALTLAEPPVRQAAMVSPRGVVYLGRQRQASHRVWSRARGYPSHPRYREFYWELGDDPLLGAHTGLKYHAIDKQPYDPASARAQVARDVDDFASYLSSQDGLVVAAYDAELFGHWWFEGVDFLEGLLRKVGAHAVTVSKALTGMHLPVATPAPSSWGRGGFGEVWIGPRTAPLWRHVHHVDRAVRRAAAAGGRRADVAAATVEMLAMQASDWLFMIDAGEHAEHARRRFERHGADALRLAKGERLAGGQAGSQHAQRGGWLRELDDATLCAALGAS
jgi:1,4-alpha-glucan branching enzyme